MNATENETLALRPREAARALGNQHPYPLDVEQGGRNTACEAGAGGPLPSGGVGKVPRRTDEGGEQ